MYFIDKNNNVLISNTFIEEKQITEEYAMILLNGGIDKLCNAINEKAYKDIISKYPEWKQLNIQRNKDYNFKDYNEMISYIDNIRAVSDEEINKIKATEKFITI